MVVRSRLDTVRKWIQESKGKLQLTVDTVEDYVTQNSALIFVKGRYQGTKDKIDLFGQIYNILVETGMVVKKDDKSSHTEGIQEIMQLTQVIQSVEQEQDDNLDKFRTRLGQKLIPDLMTDIEQIMTDVCDEALIEWQENIYEVLNKVDDLEASFKTAYEKSEKYKEYQQVLGTEMIEFTNVDELREQLMLRVDLWRGLKEWNELTTKWVSQQFLTIKAKDISNKADYYAKIAYKVDRELPINPVSQELKHLVDTFKKAMPIVTALRNEHLNQLHWKEIKELLGQEFEISEEDFTLNSLLEMKANDFQEEIQQISMQASQEYLLKSQLSEIDEIWKRVEFIVKSYKYKDAFILDDIEEVLVNLDESLATINTVLGSRYIKPLLSQAEAWRTSLILLQNVVDEWVLCQRQWIYLENIFSAPDIKRHLAAEATKFELVDKFFRGLMTRVSKAPNALRLIKTIGNLYESLKHHNTSLDEIQKQLEEYLETKRRDFPRFYFLSNDELLEILANSQNLEVIQQNLKKCFDCIQKLDIVDGFDIVAMLSPDGERVPFFKAVKARDNVEAWLDLVQTSMRETLMKLMKMGLSDYENQDRKLFVLDHAGQIVATVCQIAWTSGTENAINEQQTAPYALGEWLEINILQLQQLTELVRGKLDAIKRKIIVGLVTTDVHARDIVESLSDKNISSLTDFKWIQQLRYYWEDEENANICYSKQINARLDYGYEYMGATSRLVITPLTDRCWITITSTF